MKTILFILPDLNQGGAERVITTLCNELDRTKFCPKLVLFKKEGYYLNHLKDDVEIIELKVSRIRYSIFKIIPLIKKLKPEIVFTGWGEISAFLSPIISLFPKTKFITRETNVVSKHVKRKEILFFYRFYNNFHQIIAQSDDMKNDLIENFRISENKIVKINNPVDFDLINRLKIESVNVGFNMSYKNIVAIGNLSPRKGFDLLLNVMNELKGENIHLTILGDGAFKDELAQQKDELGLNNVTLKGKVSNPFVYLKNADLFVLSSRYEGFPNVLLEAGACGTYSLTNNCPGGINEIVQEGINAEIFPIENSKGFAEKMKEILNQSHDKEKIVKSIYSRFSKEIIISKYESIFDKI
ncbi:glycosyltransferase [Empedobacter falsenii]|uniref:Glycosyltransferase n=1 Tax=Empedobacter falsenii TaxID=343874 RepID=A0A427BHD7_9FLAO|nr:glycosyltransferase [Empedobacter falsenii]RRT87402.1 glycosyltransferase [Empedobacter falsenii]RRT88519.1 glycosyltransferase [Empedobacter falsenii]